MELPNSRYAVAFHIDFTLRTPLLLLTGDGDEVLDNTIDKTPDDRELHINGYVWASLVRRALTRIAGGSNWAEMIGKYDAKEGVSPLWCDATFVELPGLDSRHGIMIDRKWGAATTGALYSEQTVPPGIRIPMDFTWFAPGKTEDAEAYKQKLVQQIASALWVINDGIENIGGGWSYGFGRLAFQAGRFRLLDLSNPNDRKALFRPVDGGDPVPWPMDPPEKAIPWEKMRIPFKIADGQLLAIHTRTPLLEEALLSDELPDAFIFRSYVFDPAQNRLAPTLVVPGKAVRQALFSQEIERRLRTGKETICYITDQMIPGAKTACTCKRCKWFGSTFGSGILAVLDATVEPCTPDGKVTDAVLHRIQLCEHSGQNMNLFAGEYLIGGSFTTEVLIDQSRQDAEHGKLKEYIDAILAELKPNGGPPGWHRIGATSTCTGQIELIA